MPEPTPAPDPGELDTIKNAAANLLADAAGGELVGGYGVIITDLSQVAISSTKTKIIERLSDLLPEEIKTQTKTACYLFAQDGSVTQLPLTAMEGGVT